jgi:hypothetical protein
MIGLREIRQFSVVMLGAAEGRARASTTSFMAGSARRGYPSLGLRPISGMTDENAPSPRA